MPAKKASATGPAGARRKGVTAKKSAPRKSATTTAAPPAQQRLPRPDLRQRQPAVARRRLDVRGRRARRQHDRRQLRLRRRARRARRQPAGRCRLRGPPGERADDQHRRPAQARTSGTFGTTLVAEERPTIKQQGDRRRRATFIDTTDTPVSGLIDPTRHPLRGGARGRAIEEPTYLATPTAFPPPVRYWHLDVPADVSLGCNADRAHRAGIDRARRARSRWSTPAGSRTRASSSAATGSTPPCSGPGTADAGVDENGHGTGESANIFATAPDVLAQAGEGRACERRARQHDGRLQRRRGAEPATSSPTAGRRASSSAR